MNCRHCQSPLRLPLVDLGTSPPSNSYLTAAQLQSSERYYPLRVFVCENCWLAQTEDYTDCEELFDETYAYFSSMSSSWVAHAKLYAERMVERFGLQSKSHVVEVASNDGYLLQHFKAKGIRCLGVEPTASTAEHARRLGLNVEQVFFGREVARELRRKHGAADLMAANNVLAHVPDINDFVAGFAELLSAQGVATFEFPHLLQLMRHSQFDTIYHEHFSYLSLLSVERVFGLAGLDVFDVEELTTHGGSLRVFAQRTGEGGKPRSERLALLREVERHAGMATADFYRGLQSRAERIKDDLLRFLLDARAQGRRVAAYGAAAKGNTLLNFAGVRPDLLSWVVDRSPGKQGRFLPGCRIPVVQEERIKAERPDYLLLLPWNLRGELQEQLSYVRAWGCRFVTAVPRLEIA